VRTERRRLDLDLRSASPPLGENDAAAVGVGDVVEAEKLTGAPTHERASYLVRHRRALDLGDVEGRDDTEELVAGLSSLEAGSGPRTELRLWDVNGILLGLRHDSTRSEGPGRHFDVALDISASVLYCVRQVLVGILSYRSESMTRRSRKRGSACPWPVWIGSAAGT
jgi:hypothetical protein